MASPSSSSVSHPVSPILRFMEGTIGQICHRISQQGVIALLKTALLFLAVFGLKGGLISIFGYRCPQQGHFFYGNIFIFGPTVFFLCFALVFSRPFWEFVTGCCGLNCALERLLRSPSAAVEIYLAISAPFLWVAAALSEEKYYLCAMYGLDIEYRSWGTPSPWDTEYRWNRRYWGTPSPWTEQTDAAIAECHVLVWAIITSWAIISAIMVSLYRCNVRDEKEKYFV